MRHFCTTLDLTSKEIRHLIDQAVTLKRQRAEGRSLAMMTGKVLGLLFEKPSMRTRVSFEAACAHLGGTSVFLSRDEVGLGKRESVADIARVISQYVDMLAVRTFSHQTVVELSTHATCPVINALSDYAHPCQALADLATVQDEFGRLDDVKLVFVGDGNNVARSLALSAARCNARFVLSAPPGYEFSADFLDECHALANNAVTQEADPKKAVEGAHVVYTDVWASMGQESEKQKRLHAFKDYQVTSTLMERAMPEARFLHCLPAHRGEEVAAEVIDGPQSLIVEQAAYRLHAQKALMIWLLEQAH